MSFTKEQLHQIYIEAKNLYEETVKFNEDKTGLKYEDIPESEIFGGTNGSPYLCDNVHKAARRLLFAAPPFNNNSKLFPELLSFKPADDTSGCAWWPLNARTKRFEVLDKCIEMTKPEEESMPITIPSVIVDLDNPFKIIVKCGDEIAGSFTMQFQSMSYSRRGGQELRIKVSGFDKITLVQ